MSSSTFCLFQLHRAQLLHYGFGLLLADFFLFYTFSSIKNFTIPILIDRIFHQSSYIFQLPASAATQIDPVHIDIWIAPTLQRAVSSILAEDIWFLFSSLIVERETSLSLDNIFI